MAWLNIIRKWTVTHVLMFWCNAAGGDVDASRFRLPRCSASLEPLSMTIFLFTTGSRATYNDVSSYSTLNTHEIKYINAIKTTRRPNVPNILCSLHVQIHPIKLVNCTKLPHTHSTHNYLKQRSQLRLVSSSAVTRNFDITCLCCYNFPCVLTHCTSYHFIS